MSEQLLSQMQEDMGIYRYSGEPNDSFAYRVCYSALGQWCLGMAKILKPEAAGIAKKTQTDTLNELLESFSKLFSLDVAKFASEKNTDSFSVFVRETYERTGYLLTDENNCNRLANYGRSIQIGNKSLFFGTSEDSKINGLGVFATPTEYMENLKDFLRRDNLTCEEYLQSRFDSVDFAEKSLDPEPEFFNPLRNTPPSRSWEQTKVTEMAIARQRIGEGYLFYRVMDIDGKIHYAEESGASDREFTSREYRRLYLALKSHYGAPLKADIVKLDREYSRIILQGHLPNREYYLMLLLSWPERNAFNKTNFVIRNEFLHTAEDVFSNIGIKVIR